jgi:hypothetical protein
VLTPGDADATGTHAPAELASSPYASAPVHAQASVEQSGQVPVIRSAVDARSAEATGPRPEVSASSPWVAPAGLAATTGNAVASELAGATRAGGCLAGQDREGARRKARGFGRTGGAQSVGRSSQACRAAGFLTANSGGSRGKMTNVGRLLALVVCALTLLSTPLARAQDTSPRERARALGEEGLKRYDEGDFAAAVGKLDEAYKIYPAPTLGLYSARSLAKLGRLIEAWQRYLQVSRAPLESDASDQLKQAKADATGELTLVEKRIPVLRFEITGTEASGVAVTLNGEVVASQEVARGRRVNPGSYDIRGERGDEVVTAQVTLGESETKTAVLRFQPKAPAAPPPVVAPPAPAPVPAPAQPPPTRDNGSKTGATQRTVGWVLLAVGGVGLGVGAVSGIVASSKKSDLEGVCGDIAHCPESARGDVDSYNTLRTVSTIGFIGGGVGVAAGAVLLLTAPRSASGTRGRVQPYVGIGHAGVRGAF